MNTRRLVAVLAISCTAALLTTLAEAATPADPAQARIQELQSQVDALNQEMTQLKATSDPTVQQQYMQRHWSLMQDHMRSVRGMPGMYAQTCSDWVMMDSSLMGSGTWPNMWGPGMGGCGWADHGMGMSGAWGMPPGMSPGMYQSQMQGQMQRMNSQMAAIAAEKDPKKREALLREHYETTYRSMQSMRGMGWMWAPTATASLPDQVSHGAKLVASVCSQCHSPPAPSLHTATEWATVTARMRQHADQTKAAGGGVRVPSAAELDEITEYLSDHAAAAR